MTNAWGKRIVRIVIIVGLILLLPLVLQLTIGTGVDGQGFNWTVSDFIAMGGLLLGTGLAIDVAARKLTHPTHRIAAIIAIVFILLIVWAELAVGIFGSPFAGS